MNLKPLKAKSLSRVKDIVKKYEGIFTADSEDGGFTAEILIPMD